MKLCFSILLIISLCLGFAVTTPAQNRLNSRTASQVSVPRLVKFSGTAKDETGHPKSGVVGITFALYKEEQGGAPLWLETQNVQADSSGHYTVLLGSTKAEGLPAEIFSSNDARWLGVQVEGQSEQPRTLLVSAPYALKAADAETLGGKPLSAFQLIAPQGQGESRTPSATPAAEQPNEIRCSGSAGCNAGSIPEFASNGGSATVSSSSITQTGAGAAAKIGLGTTSPGARLDVLGSDGSPQAAGVQVSTPTFPQYLLNATRGASNAKIWRMIGRGTNDFEIQTLNDLYGGEVTAMQIKRSGTSISNVNFPNGNVGIGTFNPGAPLQVTDQNAPTTNSVIAADLFNSNSGASALFGDALATTGTTHGVFGQIFSSSGGASAVEGVALANSGQTFGVEGSNLSSGNLSAGVTGASTASSGVTFGVSGFSRSPTGTGVYGLGLGQSQTGGDVNCCPVGVHGDTSGTGNLATGIIATADDAKAMFVANNSPTGFPTAAFLSLGAANALVAGGPTHSCSFDNNGHQFCDGPLSAVVPIDSGRQVALYAVESPQNWFEDFGSGRLQSGVGRVALETTFAQTVNTGSDYHVFLTPRGECRGLYVNKTSATGFEVHELGGGQSNVAFDYRIVALRRGSENIRLEDKTEMTAKLKGSLPKPPATPTRWTLPVQPKAFTTTAIPSNAVVVQTKATPGSSPH